MARFSVSLRNNRKQLFRLYFEWWLNFARTVSLFLDMVFRITEETYSSESIRTLYELNWYTHRKIVEKFVYKKDSVCYNYFRMNRMTFVKLCELLSQNGKLESTRNISLDEMVAITLWVLSHHTKNSVAKGSFERSGETVSRVVNKVIRSIIRLQATLFVTRPEAVPDDSTDFTWKWFKGCVGALDGTFINAHVQVADRARYRNRKGAISVNVLGACTHNMQFIYVLPGWEGSAVDGRVLRDAIIRRNGLGVRRGTYYLVDAGYTNCEGFLAPYRGQRYHLNDWREGYQPRSAEEIFNKAHASARNVIERCFGVLKQRWAILRSPAFYPIKVQNMIIMACALLHNFIRREVAVDLVEEEYDQQEHERNDNEIGGGNEVVETISNISCSDEWSTYRNTIATTLWNNYRNRQRR